MTAILFLLGQGETSRWHRVTSDELWHFCEGDPLDLLVVSPQLGGPDIVRLSGEEGRYFFTVPAGHWQAARSTGRYSLVSCVVAPGFDFDDFQLLSEAPALREEFLKHVPGAAAFA
jgi:predicted cupin superfamily sugar epimerase